ncbi:PilX N-terminal domain-containing pilus assembly protein [Guyparkeria halophila]|uniref:PilX N-terminal domain-containing pilus assembly protein n=1 Tax=Guyparkeria halophila TaxID=47960 RepID=A0ABZ0YWN5_9GAMM|nr:PilX N-terminal domain-containing pilus assembly protein [Guyparkeria halophila]WQH16588.1 PilX N-terminal domain-containing pilus assembly protein [Guyparkeria halophila]
MIVQRTDRLTRKTSSRQRGVALVIALVLLIAVTLVGLAGIRGTTLQEKMSSNSFDRETAFQAAEAAMEVAATRLTSDLVTFETAVNTYAELDCTNRLCAINPGQDVPAAAWFDVTDGVGDTNFSARDSAIRPQFVVQDMGSCATGVGGGNFVGTTDQNEAGGGAGTYFNDTGQCFRITARAIDPALEIDGADVNADRAQVILQATYRL